jgi:hypothetical protein
LLALVDSMRSLEPATHREEKDYLEGFFRMIDKPASIKEQFVAGGKPEPTI